MGRTRKQQDTVSVQNRVLIHQLELDHEQSAELKRDMALVLSLHSAEQKANTMLTFGKAALVGALVATAYLLVTGGIPELVAGVIALVGLFATPTMEHFVHKASKVRSTQLAQIKVATHISDFYTQYAAGETISKKVANYVALLTHKNVQIGKFLPYQVHLDTTNDSGYVVRLFS